MGIQLDNITAAPDCSLTFILNDVMSRRPDGRPLPAAPDADLEGWLNALSRQAVPIVASRAGQAQLEAWLDLVGGLPEENQVEDIQTQAGQP